MEQENNISNEEAKSQENQTLVDRINELEEEVKKSKKSDDGGNVIVNLILALIVIGVLWWLCPSKVKVQEKIAQDIVYTNMQKYAPVFGMENYANLVDKDDIDGEEALERMEDHGDEINVKNFLVLKVAYYKPKGKKERLAGIGVCGFVIPLIK